MTDFPQRIVFVDDEPSVRKVVRDALERAYPEIILVTCGGGEELLTRLRELQPELILLDLKMPKMSGPDVVDALRKNPDGKDIPIIFMTGTRVGMTDEYKAMGVIGVIHKPFEAVKLAEEISALWQGRQGNLPVAENSVGN